MNNKDLPVLFCDIDGVIADLITPWLKIYNENFNDNLTPHHIIDWDISKFVTPECGKHIFQYLEQPHLYDDVEPIEGALDAIEILRKDYKIIFVTTPTIGTLGRKFLWLQDNGFLDKDYKALKYYIETGDKGLLRGNVLIDDGIHNLDRFHGTKVVFSQPWNIHDTTHNLRIISWSRIRIKSLGELI